jgi:RNA polymerase sigma-70 factor, ECF subfamily
MERPDPHVITRLLHDLRKGDKSVEHQLIPLVYADLRRIAGARLRREVSANSFQPTALVNEAYLRIANLHKIDWQDRTHFFAVAANIMRQILVDHARARLTEKRGGSMVVIELSESLTPSQQPAMEVLALNDALDLLARRDARQARVVELRFFAGMTEEETAEVLGISARTVKRDWRMAKAWLFHQLRRDGPESEASAVPAS